MASIGSPKDFADRTGREAQTARERRQEYFSPLGSTLATGW